MKPRHAVALALGWYLLYPPWSAEKGSPDPSLRLNRWYQMAAFSSLADCEANKIKVLEDMDKKTHNPNSHKATAQERMRYVARCVSADDPRLKGN